MAASRGPILFAGRVWAASVLRHQTASDKGCGSGGRGRPVPMSTPKSRNITWHAGVVTKADREQISGNKGCTIWLTGLSGSGKSTLAVALEKKLWDRGIRSYVLDGDNVRHGLNKD